MIVGEKLRASAWGVAVTAALAALIVVGLRNLTHFDAALVGYTFATLFAAFGITYGTQCGSTGPAAASTRTCCLSVHALLFATAGRAGAALHPKIFRPHPFPRRSAPKSTFPRRFGCDHTGRRGEAEIKLKEGFTNENARDCGGVREVAATGLEPVTRGL
jgi:hypothetical protein